MGGTLNVGIIGVGVISAQYLNTIPKHDNLRLVAVADLNADRTREVAAEHGLDARTVDELIDSPDIDAIINLTIPAAHAEIALRTIAAGKHTFGEKPLALTVAEGKEVLEAADAAGVRVGSAPDSVLGDGIQTARALLDSGRIGEPFAASVNWVSPGHESWHPAPAFYYQPGGGPLYDMGPYYLTSLVHFFGPVVRVSGTVNRSTRERVIATGPNAGSVVPVGVDTHVSGLLEHASGVTSHVTMSFEVWASKAPQFEVYGTAGTVLVSDPNRFSDTVSIAPAETGVFEEVPTLAGYTDGGRGVGLADMARAIATGRPHRATGELALHVLDIMESIITAGREHRTVTLRTTAVRPDAIPTGAAPNNW